MQEYGIEAPMLGLVSINLENGLFADVEMISGTNTHKITPRSDHTFASRPYF